MLALSVLQVYPFQVSGKNVRSVEFILRKYIINSKWMLCIAVKLKTIRFQLLYV